MVSISTDAFGFTLAMLVIGMTVAAFQLRKPVLAFCAVMMWGVLGAFVYSLSATTWDIYFILAWACFGMCIVCALEAMVMKPKEEQEQEPYLDEIDNIDKEFDDMAKGMRAPRLGHRGRARAEHPLRIHQFAKTGKEPK